MRPESNFDEAVERLYEVFSAVPKPRRIDGCPCCIDRKEVDTLLGKGLRELTPDDLSAYAFSAFKTVGEVADYLYFLPRILEISATESSWWPSPEITGQAIRDAGVETWTAVRREAMNGFLEAVVDAAIRSGDYRALDAWLCAAARMGLDVRPFLDQVARSPEAVLGYFEENAQHLPRKTLTNQFWELPCPGHDAVVAWFHSHEIAKIPFQAYGYKL